MVRRVWRWTMRGIKTVLALIALAAVVAWPWSYGPTGRFGLARWSAAGQSMDAYEFTAGAARGDVVLVCNHGAFDIHEQNSADSWWEWVALSTDVGQPQRAVPYSLGTIRWDYGEGDGDTGRGDCRWFSFPCWLLALTAGAWPGASAFLGLRRRRRARRDAAAGRCRHCGYDLRATPSPGGALLGRCPECGRPSDIAGTSQPDFQG